MKRRLTKRQRKALKTAVLRFRRTADYDYQRTNHVFRGSKVIVRYWTRINVMVAKWERLCNGFADHWTCSTRTRKNSCLQPQELSPND